MNLLPFDEQKPLDFIAVGRLCIDLNANEIHRPMEETVTFTKYVGGSPANIAIGMARLGMKTGFIGRVADDQMGRFIVQYLKNNGIDTSHVITDKSGSVTGLAFTEIKSPTDCSILMYRDNVADLKLEPNDIHEDYIRQAKCLLISGTALAKSPSREAVFLALEYARRHGVVVFFDLDYRPYTWQSKEETAIYYNLAAEKCDVIIGTREEFDMMEQFAVHQHDDEKTAQKWFDYHAKIVVIKHGKDGSIAYTKTGETFVGTIFPANIVKTFGAGDSYAAGFIYGLMNGWPIPKAMEYGAAAASIVISSHSCSDAMPTLDQIEQFIQQHKSSSTAAKS
ncbi:MULTISPECIES: 5-dehydro-2-deoxygluconokinase [Geobacillus]|jgi:5-dehydro-2-deoxygluconokinase|uniref:5-dehydro-2-deoxygluconokinase n=1 Tax=Geobacillus thermodenitrificans TaxID=33940 RepID=A0ABY9Q9D8_GEOTD|nr:MULTISPECIES: 5-dehydro-2-deoxygluconokinase [Geobacillus]ARA99600.1 5-dehydro-2-deoxygluconokinase [Geobacillus thermodenitrificans]ATO35806.1 5-dehydro-2-deoxygluconokinase [Geobacillus thermodenitrificans]MEC5186868.1 5-dehydro-2-deoxygluconokinase [Geobacillus thermodenitrificans]MED0661947.1 5-dehydro-2-deoxygluconokinase [Geobacillus thermodenitrificans]MED3716356.1 5-dehydro-2-deoxygluconokinase [Geobacillus thermodenitrificans]